MQLYQPTEPEIAAAISLLTTRLPAAAGGRIRGASQDAKGRWRLPKRTFRHWLTQSRPKPRSK